MNSQVKVLLTIQGIPGGIIKPVKREVKRWTLTKAECSSYYNGKDKNRVIKAGKYTAITYEVIPCSQSIKLTYDAYEYMTSGERPEWFKGPWKKMSKEQRLVAYLHRICEDMNGTDFTYHILED